MTSKQKQIRAVALAALMVMSVFAGTIALSGSAAAVAQNVTVDSGSEVVDPGDAVTFTVTDDDDDTNDTIQYWLDLNNDETYQSSEPNGSVSLNNSTSGNLTLSVPSDQADGTYKVAATESASITDGTTSADVVDSFAVDADSPKFLSAIHYANGSTPEVEVAFSENVGTVNELNVSTEDSNLTQSVAVQDGRIVATLSDVQTDELQVEYNVTDTAGNELTGTETVTFAGATAQNASTNAYKGSLVAIVADSTNEDVEIEGLENSYVFSGSTGTNSKVFLFNTENRDLGDYNYTLNNGDEHTISVRDLGLEVSLDSQNVTTADDISGDVTANAGGRTVEVSLLDSDGNVYEENTTVDSLSGQGELDFAFPIDQSGEYTVEATDLRSGVTVESSAINVASAADGDAAFGQKVVTQQRGDVAEIPINLQGDNTEATVQIGSSDVGFIANTTVSDGNDDGKVTILFNTYAATNGVGGDVVSAKNSDDDVSDVTIEEDVDSLLDAGDYDLSVSLGSDYSQEDETDVATLVLEERSTNSINTWTAPSALQNSDELDKDALYTAAQNGELTQDSEIARGDIAVHQLNVSGLEGAMKAQGGSAEEAFLAIDGNDSAPVSFVVNQTEAGANRAPFEVNLTSGDLIVVPDYENDTYFLLFDTGDVQTDAGNDLESGEGLTATFSVNKDEGNLSDSTQTVQTDYEVVESTVSMDEPVNVTATSEQNVTGESSLAPGTELNLRVRSTDGTRPSFLKTGTAVVQSDGTFSAAFDFSAQNAGDAFTVNVRDVKGTPADENEGFPVDGNIVEGSATNETETVTDNGTETVTDEPTETTETATTEAPETTEATATEETATDEPTETTTPGFGAIVALVALVAAALLATRRD